MLCDDLEGWGGVSSGRQVQEGDICIFMANSRQCMAETNTTLSNNFPLSKKKGKNYLSPISLKSVVSTSISSYF